MLKIELPGKFSYFLIPHKVYISDNRNNPQKRHKNVKTLKKALKDDVKAKSANIHYFYLNILISELNFLFLNASQHIITRTLKTAFLTFFNMDFFHFFREQTQKMQ